MNNSNHTESADHSDAECPKRIWIMTTLADDEAMALDRTLPRGLQFHLSRCESCRALADRLQTVAGSLASLAALEPADGLADAAQTQAQRALAEGAKLTGRVSIPDEPEAEPVAGATTSAPWRRLTRYAAAASIVIAATLYGLSRSAPDGPAPASKPKRIAAYQTRPVEGQRPKEAADRPKPRAPETVVDAEEAPTAAAPETLALGSPKARKQRVCRHRTPLEAAMCEKPHAMHRIMMPARRRSRGAKPVWPLIDNSHSTRNTRPRRPEK